MKRLLFFLLIAATGGLRAQDAVTYRTPPKEISDLLLAKPTPAVSIDSKADWMLLIERNSYPSVEEMAMPELRIAGMRINPSNFSASRQSFINNFSLKNIKSGTVYPLTGLPMPLLAGAPSWSPSENKVAFTHTTQKGVDLYVFDVASRKAVKMNKQPLNMILGGGITWLDDQTLLYKTTVKPAALAPARPLMPKGPVVQENLGKAAPSVTYQDLIKSPYDEALFEFYATSQLVQNKSGIETPIGKPEIYSSLSLSPDKKYLLVRSIRKPFSYLVTSFGFPSTVTVRDRTGKVLKTLAELPSTEGTPSGYDNTQNVPRAFDWRDDEPATVTYAFPLDSGIMKTKMNYHDVVYAVTAPFTAPPKELFRTAMRFRGISWGSSSFALISEGQRSTQMNRVSIYNPSTGAIEKLYDLSSTNAYANPGTPVTTKNQYGRNVILTLDNGTKLLMNNTTGASAEGDRPFISKYDLKTGKNDIVWRSSKGAFEVVTDVIDPDKLILLTRRESQVAVPNYFIKDLGADTETQITRFANPYPQLEGVTRQKISYKRADGVDLTGDLYLPKGYNKERDGKLPVLIWAYPREFNSASDAAQVRGSQDRFTTISWSSPIFQVTQGYAVLDNAEMPIVAKDGKKPNDTFVEQLKLNAEAAINKLDELGVGDRNRVGVGGHSYGAFMTANLLAHTNLFKAGIARSGAYNRTLTPFGFQNEERTYWQAPELYLSMSPFSYADRIKTPILLIHGDSDDNTGTYPINSERLFAAIKGHGGTVRFAYLPFEAHSYRGRENLLHMLWEQNQWLEKYVKNAGSSTVSGK